MAHNHDWERNWDFDDEQGLKRFLPKVTMIVIACFVGLFLAFLGGLFTYFLFTKQLERTALETAILDPHLTPSDLAILSVEKNKDTVVGVNNFRSPMPEVKLHSHKNSSGSGVIFKIVDSKAYIVTNHHVIEGAERVSVISSNGEEIEATVTGSDPFSDIAVLQIPAYKVNSVAHFGDSDQLKIAETVIAIGNPLGVEYSQTVTQGIVSGKNRMIPTHFDGDSLFDWEIEAIQIDAAINFGNSGGPLLNLRGEVVGINSAKIVESGVEGIGFSIPINHVKPIVTQLIEWGKVLRPYLGIIPVELEAIPKETYKSLMLPPHIDYGVMIWSQPEGPASRAGLQVNDVITKIDQEEITSQLKLRKVLFSKQIGDKIEITFYRKGIEYTSYALLEEMP